MNILWIFLALLSDLLYHNMYLVVLCDLKWPTVSLDFICFSPQRDELGLVGTQWYGLFAVGAPKLGKVERCSITVSWEPLEILMALWWACWFYPFLVLTSRKGRHPRASRCPSPSKVSWRAELLCVRDCGWHAEKRHVSALAEEGSPEFSSSLSAWHIFCALPQ